MKTLFKQFILVCVIISFVQCAPKQFTDLAFSEELITPDNDTISFKEMLAQHPNEKIIQIYASYCPVSQERFDEIIELQKKDLKKSYIFLSVDHSFIDFKHGLQYVTPKGKRYFIHKKGKGKLGEFLKLKSVPRFLAIDNSNQIKKFNTSKVPK